MPLPAAQAAQHFRQYTDQASALAARWHSLDAQLQDARRQADQATRAAATDLASAWLPELSPAALARAGRLTGFQGFQRRDPIRAMEREAHVLRQAVARIEADERFRRREYLVGPVGELTRKRQETTSLLDPWEQECARFEGQEGFAELVAAGYDTPAFALRFWEPAYWRMWAAGDRICEALGMGDFGDEVLPAYQKVEVERARWRRELALVDERIDQVHALVQERDQAQARLPELPRLYLEGAWQVLGEHLRRADPQLLASWQGVEAEDRPVLLGLRRLSGCLARQAFLDELHVQGVKPVLQDLRDRAAKYERKVAKYQRPKNQGLVVPEAALDPGFADKQGALAARADKVDGLAGRLLAFDAWDRFDLANEPELWWVHMTGKAPSALTPRLRSWYDRHPERRPVPVEDDPLPAVALAAAASQAAADHDFLS
jgi:hypothetical protein